MGRPSYPALLRVTKNNTVINNNNNNNNNMKINNAHIVKHYA